MFDLMSDLIENRRLEISSSSPSQESGLLATSWVDIIGSCRIWVVWILIVNQRLSLIWIAWQWILSRLVIWVLVFGWQELFIRDVV